MKICLFVSPCLAIAMLGLYSSVARAQQYPIVRAQFGPLGDAWRAASEIAGLTLEDDFPTPPMQAHLPESK